jgi:hypothetical protein
MRSLLKVTLFLAVTGCSSTTESTQVGALPVATRAAKAPLPRTYWPLDSASQRTRAVLQGPPRYEVVITTKCLNDSLVVNQILLDERPVLDFSHNYESEISITRQGRTWQKATLTKALFLNNARVRSIDPLSALSLSRTAFVRYEAPAFYFTTRIGVPDSDIFAEAEVSFLPSSGFRVVSIRKQREVE